MSCRLPASVRMLAVGMMRRSLEPFCDLGYSHLKMRRATMIDARCTISASTGARRSPSLSEVVSMTHRFPATVVAVVLLAFS
jgi:hypothetical protein